MEMSSSDKGDVIRRDPDYNTTDCSVASDAPGCDTNMFSVTPDDPGLLHVKFFKPVSN